MKTAERGFLLLASPLGVPERRPLTNVQTGELLKRIAQLEWQGEDRSLVLQDLKTLGYGNEMAQRILDLLEGAALLNRYLARGETLGIVPITRASETYPPLLRRRLGMDAPGCLWARGDLHLLEGPAISLVGSRELREDNRAFAEEAGRQAALQGLVLVSGNARGADRTAQDACLEAGGKVISVVADALQSHSPRKNLLWLSERSYEEPFSARRALSRNRIIHGLGVMTLVAQSNLGKGGTWDGTIRNLRLGHSPVACYGDGSPASLELERRGAYLVTVSDLKDLCAIRESQQSFLENE